MCIYLTSRPEGDIQSRFTEWDYAGATITLDNVGVSKDIRAYIHTRVREDEGLKRWRSQPNIQDEIETTLMGKVDGM